MKKYQKGEPIKTLSELLPIIFEEHQSIYFGDRIFSAAFVANWSIGCVTSYLHMGRLCRAEPSRRRLFLFEASS